MPKAATETTTKVELRYPDRFNVVVVNDNFTPVEFVVAMLIEVFNHNLERATALTLLIHNQGKAVAGTYGLEIAEQKKEEATLMARHNGHPLKIVVEKI
jgi:ATP-dependent Clp protease adaptor protein ClpS